MVPTPDNANKMVKEFERWSMSLPTKASHAQLDAKPHQVVIQRAYDEDKPRSPAEIERELHESDGINKIGWHYHPRYCSRRGQWTASHNGRLPQREGTAHYETYGVFLRGDHCYTKDYVETKRINRCLNCHELTRHAAAAAN